MAVGGLNANIGRFGGNVTPVDFAAVLQYIARIQHKENAMPPERPTLEKSLRDRAKLASLEIATVYYGGNGVATAIITPRTPNHIVVPISILAQSQWRNTRGLSEAARNTLLTTIDSRQVFLQTQDAQGGLVTSERLPLSEISPVDRRYQQQIECSPLVDEVDNTGLTLRVRFDGKELDEFQSIIVNYKQVRPESLSAKWSSVLV